MRCEFCDVHAAFLLILFTLAQDVPARLSIIRTNDLVRIGVQGEAGCTMVLERAVGDFRFRPFDTNYSKAEWIGATAGPTAIFRAAPLLSYDEPGSAWIFNGRTLAGWNGNTNLFRVVESAIVGGFRDRTQGQNEFLCTDRVYTNFVLRTQCRLIGFGGGFVNSGIQFRSKRTSATAVSGYQADMGEGYWGSLYDESRRNVLLATADASAVNSVLRPNDWNSFVIRAEDARIRIWVNDLLTIDFTETNPSISREGIIGFQVHQGGPAEASFKDVQITELP